MCDKFYFWMGNHLQSSLRSRYDDSYSRIIDELSEIFRKIEERGFMIEILKFELVNKNALIAKFNVKMVKWGGLVIRECTYFESGDKKWINLPSRQYEVEGKKKYFAYLGYEDRTMNDKFQKTILDAVIEYMEKNCKPQAPQTKNYSDEEIPF